MTEKNYNSKQKENSTLKKQKNLDKDKKLVETKLDKKSQEENENSKIQKEEINENKKEDINEENKKDKKTKEIPKKEEAIINARSLDLSTKDSASVCRFIKFKTIEKAIEDLEEVLKFKKVIPMKKGFPHKKGKGVMAGKYHTKTVRYFIRLLKELKANSDVNKIEEPVIVEAIANKASMPYGRFGRIRRKRTHIKLKSKEKSLIKKNKK